jgi:hypothetical protein
LCLLSLSGLLTLAQRLGTLVLRNNCSRHQTQRQRHPSLSLIPAVNSRQDIQDLGSRIEGIEGLYATAGPKVRLLFTSSAHHLRLISSNSKLRQQCRCGRRAHATTTATPPLPPIQRSHSTTTDALSNFYVRRATSMQATRTRNDDSYPAHCRRQDDAHTPTTLPLPPRRHAPPTTTAAPSTASSWHATPPLAADSSQVSTEVTDLASPH